MFFGKLVGNLEHFSNRVLPTEKSASFDIPQNGIIPIAFLLTEKVFIDKKNPHHSKTE